MIGLMYSISAMTTADIFHREASILMHLEATFRFCFNICMCVYVFITYLYTFLNLFFCCIIICHMTLNMIDVICLGSLYGLIDSQIDSTSSSTQEFNNLHGILSSKYTDTPPPVV
jgi:hypothetical protein